MIVAIMQPYLFPYIGYFQLMNAVDLFVVYDDAQYMKGGWINRNRILRDGSPSWLTLPIKHAGVELPITRREYLLENSHINSFKQRLHNCYREAPNFEVVFDWVCDILAYGDSNVANFNMNQLVMLADRLGIGCGWDVASSHDNNPIVRGQDRVIDVCRQVGATTYINSIGGAALYESQVFAQAGIKLQFLRSRSSAYVQSVGAHVPHLSIIDVMMFNPMDRIASMLTEYDLISDACDR